MTIRSRVRRGGLALALLSVAPGLLAVPAQVANLRLQSNGALSWDPLAGVAGYNAYRGDVAALKAGDYGACLVGSVQGSGTGTAADAIPPGSAVFFLVDAFDESGEGPLADSTSARPSQPCIPARRFFGLTPDGDPGDGIVDGTAPLRNPDALLISLHRETSGVLLHTGEFVLSAVDLDIVERETAGTFQHELGHTIGLDHGGPGSEIATDRFGRIKVRFPWDREGTKDNASAAGAPVGGATVPSGWNTDPDAYRKVVVPYCVACHSTSNGSGNGYNGAGNLGNGYGAGNNGIGNLGNGYGAGNNGTGFNGNGYGDNGYGGNGFGSNGTGDNGYGGNGYGSNGTGDNGYGGNGVSALIAWTERYVEGNVATGFQPERPARDIVDFWVYGDGGSSGGGDSRSNDAALDDRGYRPVPLICTTCHGGGFASARSELAASYAVARTYRSQAHYAGPLGQGWDFAANARLSPAGNDVAYFDGTGRRETYVRLDATHFAPTAGRYALLFQNAGGSFSLRDAHGTIRSFHAFDGSNRSGTIESAVDRQGSRASFLYDAQGLLTTVVDPLGRAIRYAYNGDGTVASITDFAGRTVVYAYDANGNLTSVRSPIVTGTPNGNDFPGGRTTTYTYSTGFADERLNHNLIGVIRPDESASGVPAVQNVYGSDPAAFTFDRVVAQTIGGTNAGGVSAGGSLSYAYQPLNAGGDPNDLGLPRRSATVIDRNGNRRDFLHNANGNCLTRIDSTNRELRPGEPDYTSQFTYDADGEVTKAGRPQGGWSEWRFDKPGADRYREGNVLSMRSVADARVSGGRGDGHGGESADIVSTFTYEPIFNEIASATDPRGNDPAYVPQNGGTTSPARYTRSWSYDWQEGDPQANGIAVYAARYGISLVGASFGLGDLNGDGTTLQAAGNPVRLTDPAVQLDPASMQAGIQGSTLQTIMSTTVWNAHGQPTTFTDPEQNRHTFTYFPETDPDGDGTPTPPPPDGRILDPAAGGLPSSRLVDSAVAPGRDNGANPGPISIQTDYQYDVFGNLAAIVDGRGVETRLIHNALGEIVEARRADATADASGPDGTPSTGRGETGLAAFGYLTRFAYDADGNVVTIQREDRGATRGVGPFVETRATFDILDDVVQADRPATSSATLSTRYRYDANQNLVRITEPDGNGHARAWDERDLLLSSTRGMDGPFGGTPSTRRYDFDGDGVLTRITDGRGGLIDFQYDGHDRLTTIVDPIGGTTGRFYDPAGDVVRVLARGTPGGPSPADRSGSGNVDLSDARALYDEMRRRIGFDALLFVPAGVFPARPARLDEGPLLPGDGAVNTRFEYDRLSRLTFAHADSGALNRLDYDGAGRPIQKTDPAGGTVAWTWDAEGNPIEEVATETATQPGPVQERFVTTLFYDALGRPTMSVDSLGDAERSVYDSLDAVTTGTDANGPPGGSIARRSPGLPGTSVPINANGNVTRYAWDATGRPIGTTHVLTASGKGDGTLQPPPDLSNPSNPDGLITNTTVWTGDDLPGRTMDDKGNVTTYAYDNLDRAVRVGRSDGLLQQFGYDAEDDLVSRLDPNGTQVTNGFDPAWRMTVAQISASPGGGVTGTTLQTWEYDGAGRVTRAFADNQPADTTDDVAVLLLHDSLGRPVEEAQMSSAGAGGTRYSDFGWRAADLMTSLTYPSGDMVAYGYDGAERVRSMNDAQHPELMATFEYFGLRRIASRQSGNGVRLTFLDDTSAIDTGYDGLGRPIRMRHLDPSNALLAGFEYRYDRAGRRTGARRLHDTDPLGNARGRIDSFDSAGRLVSSIESYLDTAFNPSGTPLDATSWTLDGPGNWAALTRNGTQYLDTPNNLNEYDEPQCCGAHSEDGARDDFLDVASTPTPDGLNLTYDRNGNQTDTSLQTLDYDFANRPVAARNLTTGAPVSAYAWDALGRRTRRQVFGGAGSTGTFAYAFGAGLFDGAIEEDDASGSPVRQFGFGPGGARLWQVQPGGQTSQYILEDASDSAAALTSGLAAGGPPGVLERVVYDPYGKPTFESAANQPLKDIAFRFIPQSPNGNAYLFAGMRYDPELGARSSNVNTDLGGLYAGLYNPNEGRSMYAGWMGPVADHRNFDAPIFGGGGTFSEFTSSHNHGVSSGRLARDGSVFAVYDSTGGYFDANHIKLQQDDPDGGVSSGRATARKRSFGGTHDVSTVDPSPCPWCPSDAPIPPR